MRVTLARIAIAITATLAAVLPATPVTSQAAAGEPCEFYWGKDGVPYLQGVVIVGGHAECTTTPDSLTISLTLQYRPRGGSWMVRSGDQVTGIPNPFLNIAVASPECETGAWQGVVDMRATVGGTDYTIPRETAPTIISC